MIRILCLVVLFGGLSKQTVDAQVPTERDESPASVSWQIVSPADIAHIRGSAGSVDEAVRSATRRLEQTGYVNARVVDVRVQEQIVEIAVDAGERVTIRSVSIREVAGMDDPVAERLLLTLVEAPLDNQHLMTLQQRVITDLARRGRPLARISLQDIMLAEDVPRADLFFELEIGEQARLISIEVHGDSRVSPRLVSLLAGLPVDRPLASFDSLRIVSSLERSGFVQRAAVSALERREDGVRLHLDIVDSPPGSFDLVFGYLPEDQGGGGFVGSGHVHLSNPFGGGREFAARLERLPGLASRFEASVHDPFVAGTSLTLSIAFAGVQQDSLYNHLEYRVEPGIALGPGLNVYGSASREQVRPGLAGTAIVGDRQRIARSDLVLFGAGMRFRNVDNPLMPRQGLDLNVQAERGRSQRTQNRLVEGAHRSEVRGLPFQRLRGDASYYLSLDSRRVINSRVRVGALLSDELDRTDLLRVGGARSLRGYDEDRFLVRSAVQGSLEIRQLLDAVSYLYGFIDGAYLERPTTFDLDALAGTYVGFGVGTRFDAGFGLLNVSLAMNPADGIGSPRIHAGVAFGL